ncbi:cupin domain-containing protein [Aminipila sp.]|jgi:ethanolamine utilization protein EutQ|uniref:cupin domain-containing protein n=1 Tax=Aminipila sp. TaxID=2060095 RepID=UPI001D88EDC8|nr:cupin domain-containing protein [Aminipila sp.]MBE6035827.1 cupin domain-containing protein [Clostridiales bacterium]
MKRLICAKDVEALEKQGQKVFYIDEDTLVTPSAKDAARACGIEFSTEAPVQACAAPAACQAQAPAAEAAKACDGEIDTNMIYTVLKALADKGLLQGVLDSVTCDKPYTAEKDPCGLKIVRGNTVKYEALDTGNPSDKVFYQEIINKDDGCSMNAGFITIENCQFDWECACEELYHIIEGTLTVTVDGKVYTAQPGDSVFFPNGAKVAFGSPNKMKAFYATY